MKKWKIVFWGCLSFLTGVVTATLLEVPKFIILELFCLGIFYSILFFRIKPIVLFGICMIVFSFSILITETKENSHSNLLSNFYQSSFYKTIFFPLRVHFQGVVDKYFVSYHSEILKAVLIGEKRYMSDELKRKLNIAGVRHLVAISGMHIIILSQIFVLCGIYLRLYRSQAIILALLAIWIFILMIGLPPSALRAGIMGSLLLISQLLGRESAAWYSLTIAATLMLFVDPSLITNIGFQLSFLATLGIVVLCPFLKEKFDKLKIPNLFSWKDVLSMSLAAQIFSLPILIYNFGYFSSATPFANLLLTPILPYLMTIGFLVLIAGSVWFHLGLFLSFPLWILTNYFLIVADFFSHFPYLKFSSKILPTLIFAFLVVILLFFRIKNFKKIAFLYY